MSKTPPPSTVRAAILTAIAILCASCSFDLEVVLEDPKRNPPTFRLRKPAFFFVGSTTPEIRQIMVVATGDSTSDSESILWHVSSAEGAALRRLTYGVVPEGFEEDAPARALVPGRSYTLEGQAWGGSGSLDFELLARDPQDPGAE